MSSKFLCEENISSDWYQLIVRHNHDWTKLTNKIRARLESLAWTAISSNCFEEIVLIEWKDRRKTPIGFFNYLVDKTLIYDIISIKKIYGNLFLISFTGPRKNTIRETLLQRRVLNFHSAINNGFQVWDVFAFKDLIDKVYFDLSTFSEVSILQAQINSFNKVRPEDKSFMSSFFTFNPNLSIILTQNEYETIMNAMKNKYFQKSKKGGIREIAINLGKDKSTVDRELRNGINKIINLLFSMKNP